MKHCDRCNIDYTGNLTHCPLCQSPLLGSASPAVFPHNTYMQPMRAMLIALGLTCSIAILALCFLWFAGVLLPPLALVLIIAVFAHGLLCKNAISQKPGFICGIHRYFLLLVVLALIWFTLTRFAPALTVALPIVSIASLIFDAILLIVERRLFALRFGKYLLCDIVCSYIPLILIRVGLANWPVLAIVSAFMGSIMLLITFAFFRHILRDEGAKLFNF